MKTLFLPFLLTIFCCIFLISSGPGSGLETPPTSTPNNEFYAWLLEKEHVYEANLMKLSIRLFPNIKRFPGFKKTDVNRLDDLVTVATVRLEEVSVPLWEAQISARPEAQIQRERARGKEATEWVRRAILNASGLLVVEPRHSGDDRLIYCRLVLLDELGNRTDLAKLLEDNGFASQSGVDWGRRLPQ